MREIVNLSTSIIARDKLTAKIDTKGFHVQLFDLIFYFYSHNFIPKCASYSVSKKEDCCQQRKIVKLDRRQNMSTKD